MRLLARAERHDAGNQVLKKPDCKTCQPQWLDFSAERKAAAGESEPGSIANGDAPPPAMKLTIISSPWMCTMPRIGRSTAVEAHTRSSVMNLSSKRSMLPRSFKYCFPQRMLM